MMSSTISTTRTANARLVREAQTLLTQAGFATHASGHFDRATYIGVCGFQGARSLPITGIVDDATWRALRNEITTASAVEVEPQADEEAVGEKPKVKSRRRRSAKVD